MKPRRNLALRPFSELYGFNQCLGSIKGLRNILMGGTVAMRVNGKGQPHASVLMGWSGNLVSLRSLPCL